MGRLNRVGRKKKEKKKKRGGEGGEVGGFPNILFNLPLPCLTYRSKILTSLSIN